MRAICGRSLTVRERPASAFELFTPVTTGDLGFSNHEKREKHESGRPH